MYSKSAKQKFYTNYHSNLFLSLPSDPIHLKDNSKRNYQTNRENCSLTLKKINAYTCIFSSVSGGSSARYLALVAMKRFTQTRDVGITYSPPVAVINNPGQYVFPGGEIKSGENPFDGALRKFLETTGIKFEVDATKTTVKYNQIINLPIYFDESTTSNGYNCLFIKVSNKNINDLVKEIQLNINTTTTPPIIVNDELIYVGAIELEKNLKRIPSIEITSYCNANAKELKVPRDLTTWRAFFSGPGATLLGPPGVTNTTSPLASTMMVHPDHIPVHNVTSLIKQCYDMGPLMQFIINPKSNLDFPADASTGKKEYAFIKETDVNNLPTRYSTDSFLEISEKISFIDSLLEPKKE